MKSVPLGGKTSQYGGKWVGDRSNGEHSNGWRNRKMDAQRRKRMQIEEHAHEEHNLKDDNQDHHPCHSCHKH